uniref:Uncharacterized protein n=1 Tax=Micrurus spixii TaxID=129469 RepID=A0A2D4NEM9_9SAUR
MLWGKEDDEGSSPLDPFHHASHRTRPARHFLLHAAFAGRSGRTKGRKVDIVIPSFHRSPLFSHPENVAVNSGVCVSGGQRCFLLPLLLRTPNRGSVDILYVRHTQRSRRIRHGHLTAPAGVEKHSQPQAKV